MLLLGSKAPGRHVEQHDFFFGIAHELSELVPDIKKFWKGAVGNLHIDGWREVNSVDGYQIKVFPKDESNIASENKLFFINLGGYMEGKLEEQHYVILSVKADRVRPSRRLRKQRSSVPIPLLRQKEQMPILMISMALMWMIFIRLKKCCLRRKKYCTILK